MDINKIKEMCNLFGPSGDENQVLQYIIENIKDYATELNVDKLGNLIVFKQGKRKPEKKVMLSAHMDEVGFIIKSITDEGMLKFGTVGSIDKRVIVGKRVLIGQKKGVVGIKAVHLTSLDERKKAVTDLYIDIGASSKEEAQKHVSLGDYGVFDSKAYEFGDNLLKAKALDDRLGCYILMELIKSELETDLYFLFSVQEEVGLRGATAGAYTINPDVCIVLESTTAADLANTPGHKQVCSLRGGAVIPFMDRGTIYDKELFEIFKKLAIDNNILWQTKQMIAGGTDAGRIHISRAGVKTAALSIPVRYIHSPVSVCSIDDIKSVWKLINLFIKKEIK